MPFLRKRTASAGREIHWVVVGSKASKSDGVVFLALMSSNFRQIFVLLV
jgi:hypothetical protein